MARLEWTGKRAVIDHHRKVAARGLRTDASLSIGAEPPAGGNLLIEGDNLAALAALRAELAGRVKCVYIDPPYNTGNETWAYNDNARSPQISRWLEEVVGDECKAMDRHDRWLCMMYPRLAMLREFLRDDGAIFVSIDDEELGNLLALMDEIFGRQRRVAIFTWVRKRKGSNLSKEFRKTTEYVVCYRAGESRLTLYGVPAYTEKQVPLLNRSNPVRTLRFGAGIVRVGRGLKDGPLPAQSFGAESGLSVALLNDVTIRDGVIDSAFAISGRFRWGQALVDRELVGGSVFIASRTFRVNVVRHDQATKFKALASLITPDDGVGTNEDATEELRSLLGEHAPAWLDYPKPSSLVRYLVNSVCRSDPDAIVLDSFAGSGTTGQAVLELNKADGGRRRFVCIEMDPTTAARVAARRLARVIHGVPASAGGAPGVEGTGDGFAYARVEEASATHAHDESASRGLHWPVA